MVGRKITIVRNIDFGHLAEIFILNAVISIVVIRVFLYLTGYPQLGGGGLHIAHMLWGGLLMLVSLFMTLFFLDRSFRTLAAIVGGLGFGTFIDELGKFITSDNNYFFEPTIALIYLIFISIFLLVRWLGRSTVIAPKEYLVNAFELLQQSSIYGASDIQKEKIKAYIGKSGVSQKAKKDMLDLLKYLSAPKRSMAGYAEYKLRASSFFKKIAGKKITRQIITILFVFNALVAVIYALGILGFLYDGRTNDLLLINAAAIKEGISSSQFFGIGYLLSTIINGVLVIIGVAKLARSFDRGIRFLKTSVLFSLFVVQFFAFYYDQLLALTGVLTHMALYYFMDNLVPEDKE